MRNEGPVFDEIFSLVGKQPMPVIIPILQYNPSMAWLISTKQTENRSRFIQDAIKLLGQKQQTGETPSRARQAETVPAYCSEGTCRQVEHLAGLAARKGHADPCRIAINVTGGTSIMALSASNAARKLRLPMLYVNTDENVIHHLTPDGEPDRIENIELRVPAEVYFEAHGIRQEPGVWGEAVKNGWPWIEGFIEIAENLGRAGSQSAEIMDAMRRAYQPGAPHATIPFSSERLELANMLLQRGVIAGVDRVDGQLFLKHIEHQSDQSELKRAFLEGCWLELFVFGALRDSGRFDNVLYDIEARQQVDVGNKTEGVKNQFDVVVMRRSRLAAISCKSEPMDREKKGLLYELDSLLQADMMGLYAVKILVTNQPDFTPALRARAKLSGIELITGREFPDIARKVEDALKRTT